MKTMVSTAGAGAQVAPEATDLLPPGAKAGPWRVERELGRGGMGAVYAVVHDEIGKRAALKVVHGRLLTTFNADRMLIEAKVVNQVAHPNIVDIFETGKLPDGRPYIVMERLEGQSLACRADEGKILPDQVIAILLQICDALIAAHAAGIVHRDLKLDNIFLVDNPDDLATPRVKVLDWGIAKMINHDVKHTIDGQLVGTPQYLSPEQARGAAVSPQTDVYSLGVMAYELFLEQLPFEAETSAEIMAMHLRATPPPASDLWPDIPPGLDELLDMMLAKAPDHRPTVLEVAHGLEQIRDELRKRCRAAFAHASTCATNAPIIPAPQSHSRRPSSAGFAPTMPANWLPGARRWQWAVGAFAIIASGAMFLFSRSGENAGAAAAAGMVEIHADVTAQELAPAGVEPTVAKTADPVVEPITPPNTVLAAPVVESARRAPAPRVTPRPSIVPPSSRSQVTPYRAAKIDPDGTLEPYR